VSLEPSLVVVTIAHNAKTYKNVIASEQFSISILSADQGSIADHFAGKPIENGGDDSVADFETLTNGMPVIAGALVQFACRVIQRIPLPFSDLCLGEITFIAPVRSGRPLIYYHRKYHEVRDD
jgi:flavin reductase (DIM6/NTAB) family NADH-FMN oxidoreductase RutF